MPRLSLLLALLPLFILALPSALAQEVFQWVDAEGRVIYGDRPPHDREVRSLEVQPGPTPEAAQAARERAEAAQRLADEIATERRQREAEAAAAAALRPPVPFLAEPPPEIHYHPRYVRPRWHPGWYRPPGPRPPGKYPRPPHIQPPPPQEVWPPGRAPEFTQPRRAPEFTQHLRNP
ncbi:DUF4124 domain-containing protein [Thioalkalivibrio sp.]|uniref:DUF4124 domain-containing protein n=1 Tax=Thioalkalivibrio sp. TaxID=2093813 RepID=UPI0012D5DEB4|nr:DUF4124 domain-containing protein [Thioalkalivibrio sp.]TVP82230.1 MAG: DUF4124 domain-containing protein [Thioalkalivibrio sp.]